MKEEQNIAWKDRKRILGMPLSFTSYWVKADKLYHKQGLFTTSENQIMLYRIMDFTLRRSLWQKLFGVGTIVLHSADKTSPTLEIENVRKSQQTRDLLSELVEQQRAQKGLEGRELYGVARDGHDCETDDMDL